MLLDTSGLLCCFDADESRHALAVQVYDSAAQRISHNYILAEFVALAQVRGMPREVSFAFAAELAEDAEVRFVWVDKALHGEALHLLQSQLDKTYSLCDAVSFLLMRQHAIQTALTTDHHFDQAGFRRLLPS